MLVNQFLLLGAFLFCVGVYGVLARRNGVLVLMSIELILTAVNLNLVATDGAQLLAQGGFVLVKAVAHGHAHLCSPCSSSVWPPPRSASASPSSCSSTATGAPSCSTSSAP